MQQVRQKLRRDTAAVRTDMNADKGGRAAGQGFEVGPAPPAHTISPLHHHTSAAFHQEQQRLEYPQCIFVFPLRKQACTIREAGWQNKTTWCHMKIHHASSSASLPVNSRAKIQPLEHSRLLLCSDVCKFLPCHVAIDCYRTTACCGHNLHCCMAAL